MHNEDFSILMSLLACCVSVWFIVLFVRLCGRVKAIKQILITAHGLEEFQTRDGVAYRKKKTGAEDYLLE
jgi:hypothetical protein